MKKVNRSFKYEPQSKFVKEEVLIFGIDLWLSKASLVSQTVKRLPTMLETQVRFLGQEDPLAKEMATHSSTLAWKISWTEEPDRLPSMGWQRVGHDLATSLSLHFHCDWAVSFRGNSYVVLVNCEVAGIYSLFKTVDKSCKQCWKEKLAICNHLF